METSENSLSIKYSLPKARVDGIKYAIQKFNDDTLLNYEFCYISQAAMNITGSKCNMTDNHITLEFRNLSPGSMYRTIGYSFILYKSFTLYSESRKNDVATELDVPKYSREYEIVSNRLSFGFKYPKTENCQIIFYLLEKRSNSEGFVEFDTVVFDVTRNKKEDYVIFNKKLSNLFGIEYMVQGEVKKKFEGFDIKEVIKSFKFEFVHSIPFPGNLSIVVIFRVNIFCYNIHQ
jgi:hypothetical protein